MRILVISNTTWSLVNFRLNLAMHLRDEKGYEITFCGPSDGFEEVLTRNGFDWEEISMAGHSLNPRQEVVTVFQIWRLVSRSRPDCLLLFTSKPNIYGGLISRITRVPAIHNIAGLGRVFSREKSFLRALVTWGYRLALRGSSRVFFQNEADREVLLSRKAVTHEQAHRLFGSGVDLEHYHPRHRCPRNSNPEFTFLLSARLLRSKGIAQYAKAAGIVRERLSNVKFNIIGPVVEGDKDAFPTEELQDLVSKFGLTYLGTTNRVRDFLAQADCAVLPSFYGEGLPRSLLEAAAMGLPIITTSNPGCKDAVEDLVSGWLVAPMDVDALAEAMFCAASLDPASIAKMGDASRQRAETFFSESAIFDEYDAALAIVATQ